MAILNFPSNPTVGETYTSDTGITYTYNGYAWEMMPTAGPQGEPGLPGPAGADSTVPGPSGDPGPAGPQGEKGEDSTVPGPAGSEGTAGPEGPAGPAGPNAVSADADNTARLGTDNLIYVPASAGGGTEGPVGPAGPEGPAGPPGADSIVPGPQGPPGADGATGPQGPEGPPGSGGSGGVTTFAGRAGDVQPMASDYSPYYVPIPAGTISAQAGFNVGPNPGYGITFDAANFRTVLVANSAGRLDVDPNGNITINSDIAQKTSGTAWANPSDIRLKDNVQDYTDGLSKVIQISPKKWVFNGLGGIKKDSIGIGVIADEIEKVLPRTVSIFPSRLNKSDVNLTDLKQVDISEITWLLVNSIKELNEAIKAQQVTIASLENKVNSL